MVDLKREVVQEVAGDGYAREASQVGNYQGAETTVVHIAL
jgi:hypothetical protein